MRGRILRIVSGDLTLFNLDDVPDPVAELGQYMTPRWAAELIVRERLGSLSTHDVVVDPSCGTGSWLHAIPSTARVLGVEIDPALAAIAGNDTGREVRLGDFLTIDLSDVEPTHFVGNPPYSAQTISAFLERTRSLLPEGGRAIYLLPAHTFSFARPTLNLLRGFDVTVQLVPRDLWPRLSFPAIIADLTKQRVARLVGLVLFEEAAALRSVRAAYRQILNAGRKPLWRDVLDLALEALGGEGSLSEIYQLVETCVPSTTPFWRDILRREAGEHAERVAPGRFRRRPPAAA